MLSRVWSAAHRRRAHALRMGLIVALVTGALLAVVSAAPASTSQSGAKSNFVIGYANGWIGNLWRAQFLSDLKAKASYYQKTGRLGKLVIVNTPNDLSQQINQINGLIDQKVDALLIDPVSAAAVRPVLPRAKAKNILTIISNDPAATPNNLNIVGDNYTWWKIETQWLVKALHGKGNILMITGVPGNTADVLRVKAATDVLKNYPNIHIVAKVPGWWDEAKAQQAVATVLSSHPKLDGVLQQDVTGEGVIRAFQAAHVALPKVMTGDYNMGFLRWWAKNPSVQSITVPYAPAHAADSLGFAVRLLEGQSLKSSAQQANPLDPSMKNAIMIPPPLVVTNTGAQSEPWCSALTQCISLKQAIALGKGKPDSYMLDKIMTEKQIDSYFKAAK